MSNIPEARKHLMVALKNAKHALALMTRERPTFKCRPELPALTAAQRAEVRRLRNRGWPMNRIARELGTNIGRVSETINGKRR